MSWGRTSERVGDVGREHPGVDAGSELVGGGDWGAPRELHPPSFTKVTRCPLSLHSHSCLHSAGGLKTPEAAVCFQRTQPSCL